MAHERYPRWQRRRRDWLDGLKAETGCADCGERRAWKLMFHHTDPSTKSFTIGRNSRSREATLAEIAKCVVLCRPCHVARHAYGRL